MIKAMIFDADGVVILNDLYFSQQLERDYGIPLSQTEPFFAGVFHQCLVGKADLKEELAKYIPVWGWQGTLDELLDYWFQCENHVNEELLSDIQKLRSNGIKCYLATNQEKYRTKYLSEKMKFSQLFDKVFSSADIGYKKSDKEFFAKLGKELTDIAPSEIMFWDDSKKNVAVAYQLGFNAYLYTNIENFRLTTKTRRE